jgi:hypothetical protein
MAKRTHKSDDAALPVLDEKARALLGEAEYQAWMRADPEDVARQTNRRNCYHCGTEFETCPCETHEIIAKGMGGSDLLMDPRNRIDLDALCHKRAQPSDGPTEPTLRFFRSPEGLLRSLELVDGEWVELTPYGALIGADAVSEELDEVQQLGTSLLEHRRSLEQWGDEALKTEYEAAEQVGVAQFLIQCQIIHILAERRSIVEGRHDEHAGLKGAAKYLGLAYQTARLRHGVYNLILSKAPDDEWHGLSATFFYEAYRGAGRVDPVTALRHAQDNILANPNYSQKDFAADIARGLQPQVDGVPPLEECPFDCAHCIAASAESVLELRNGNGNLIARGAKGSGAGTKYCECEHRLASALIGNEKCEDWTSRHAG